MKSLTMMRALNLMRNQQSTLLMMHTNASPEGVAWYIVPGGPVSQEIAIGLLARPDIKQRNDGMWPGHNQTWGMT